MKFCHNLAVRVFAMPEDDDAAVRTTLLSLFPFPIDDEKEKVALEKTDATGIDESRRITIYQVTLHKDRHLNAFLEKLNSALNQEQKDLLLAQHNRLDAENNFYLRLDKPRLMEGTYEITDSGDCFHIRMLIAAYPKTRQACMAVLKQIFK